MRDLGRDPRERAGCGEYCSQVPIAPRAPRLARDPLGTRALQQRAQRREQQRLEVEIEAAEAALRAVEDELSAPAAWSTPDKTAESQARHEAAKRAVEQLYERWETIAG